ncbi:MAG: NAD(P)-dependent alcohol dehydrogenase [Candidatus Heimdallarchaeota archaeon]|nr:NAD(P)-dependent alcohol dehydrogenase [Candidatus Heimdallarchaeota archaeon]
MSQPTMKAIVCEKFGPPDVLKLKEIERPTPKDDEVLIRNYATSINTVDIIARSGKPPGALFWTARKLVGPLLRMAETGIRKPRTRVPGDSFSGEIESLGKGVTGWKTGDHVIGYSKGACAEYMCVPVSKLAKKPANMNFQEAGAVPGGISPAILGIKDIAKLQKGQKILIIGASGGIGSFAVQIAKVYGAEVTGVCGPSNQEMVKELGADFVIDYTKEDFTKNGKTYDVIFDVPPKNTFSNCKNSLTERGIYVSNNFMNTKKHLLQLITSNFTSKKLKGGVADESAENLKSLTGFIEEGKIRSVIDTVYPLNKAADAHRHYETGHSKGRVVISID